MNGIFLNLFNILPITVHELWITLQTKYLKSCIVESGFKKNNAPMCTCITITFCPQTSYKKSLVLMLILFVQGIVTIFRPWSLMPSRTVELCSSRGPSVEITFTQKPALYNSSPETRAWLYVPYYVCMTKQIRSWPMPIVLTIKNKYLRLFLLTLSPALSLLHL